MQAKGRQVDIGVNLKPRFLPSFCNEDFFFSFKIYFLVRQSYRKRGETGEREGDLHSAGLFPRWLQHPWLCQTENRRQELHPGLPWGWQGPEPKDHLPLVFPGHEQGAVGIGAAGTRAGTRIGCWCFKQWHYALCDNTDPNGDVFWDHCFLGTIISIYLIMNLVFSKNTIMDFKDVFSTCV